MASDLKIISIFAMLCACGGTQRGDGTPAGEPAVETSQEAPDPLAAACEAGTVRSCLAAGESAEADGAVAEAERLYGRACELGEPAGCIFAGRLAVERDLAAAADFFERGCAADDATACYAAGIVWSGLYGGEPDPTRATHSFRRGCEGGMADACGRYAEALEQGVGVEADSAAAAELMQSACQQGDGASCVELGRRALAAADEDRARALFVKGCDTDGRACTHVGLMHVESQDAAGARAWFQRGCASDFADPDGCGWLGWHVFSGFGGEESVEEGRAMLESSCADESAVGCTFLAVVEAQTDEARASELLDRACGFDAAQCQVLKRQFEALTNVD